MDILFFVFLTLFIALKLKNTFGIRDDDEAARKRAVDEFHRQKAPFEPVEIKIVNDVKTDNNFDFSFDIPANARNALVKINFNGKDFLATVEQIVDTVSDSLTNGTLERNKDILSENMFNSFNKQILEFSRENKKLFSSLISILSKSIDNITLIENHLIADVILETEQINYIEDKDGKVIFGDKKTINRVKERWIFSRDVDDVNSSWIVANIINIGK